MLRIGVAGDQDAVAEDQHLVIPHVLIAIAIDVHPLGQSQPAAAARVCIDHEDAPVLKDQQILPDLLDDIALVDALHLVVGDRAIARLARLAGGEGLRRAARRRIGRADAAAGDRNRLILALRRRHRAIGIVFGADRLHGVGLARLGEPDRA